MGRLPVSKGKKIEVTVLLKDDQRQRTVAKKVGVSQCCEEIESRCTIDKCSRPRSKTTFN